MAGDRLTPADLFEALHTHYNETFNVIKTVWDQRNAAGAYLAAAAILVWLPSEPRQWVARRLVGDPAVPDESAFQFLVQLVLMVLALLMTQRQTYLDKHYTYLAGIEERLMRIAGVRLLARESTFYHVGITPLQQRGLWYGRVYLWLLSGLVVAAACRSIVMAFNTPGWFTRIGLGLSGLATLAIMAVYGYERQPVQRAAAGVNAQLLEELCTLLGTQPPSDERAATP